MYHPISQPGTTRPWNPQPPRRAPLTVQSPPDAGARASFYISRGLAYGREKALRGAGPLQPHEAPCDGPCAPDTNVRQQSPENRHPAGPRRLEMHYKQRPGEGPPGWAQSGS